MKRRRLIAAAFAMASVVSLSVPVAAYGAARHQSTHPANAWPGRTGLSGVNGDPAPDTASVEAFCAWRGRACGIAHVYTDRTNWSTMTTDSGGWVFDNLAGFHGRMLLSQSLVPNDGHADLTACASGEHNQDWKNFGSLMVKKGRANTIVRLGWEFNGTFMPWWAEDTKTWVKCYRNAAHNIRSTDPWVVLDWTINGHGTPAEACGGVSTNCYPGNDVVDTIGIDNYDHYPSASSLDQFNQIAAAPEGMTWLYDFARAHHKKFGVGEWGVAPASGGNTTGENPQFIQWMHDWFAAHADNLAYEAYFNNCDAGNLESNLYRPVSDTCGRQNLDAGNVYKSLFGS